MEKEDALIYVLVIFFFLSLAVYPVTRNKNSFHLLSVS